MHPDIMNILLESSNQREKYNNGIVKEIENIIHRNKPLKIWMWRVYI